MVSQLWESRRVRVHVSEGILIPDPCGRFFFFTFLHEYRNAFPNQVLAGRFLNYIGSSSTGITGGFVVEQRIIMTVSAAVGPPSSVRH